jgi:D-alanyl-D-alanine-carboxypeptidase/D-alanyl-D-alanine-endopeptidase
MTVTRRALTGALGISVLAAPFGANAAQTDRIPARREVQRILRDRVAHISAGQNDFAIAAGWIGSGSARFASFGQLTQNNARSANRDTAFEIGSITKAFTAIALADMVLRGELALDDPANRHLPSNMQLADRNGRAITLLELATHTSGLPFMAPEDALASRSDAESWLRALRVEGAGWDYSNVGYWVLGDAMAARAGMSFQDLLRTRVLERLQLGNTSFTPRTFAIPHDASMREAVAITALPGLGFMPAAGGLYSSVEDLLRVVSIAMGQRSSPLSSAIALTTNTRAAGPSGAQTQALGWSIIAGTDEIVLRDGGTLGSASCVAWNARRPLGVAVLSNQVIGVTDIARHLLDPSFPLAEPAPARHVEVALSQDVLDSFAGRYEHVEEGAFIVARDGDGLVLTLPEPWGLPPMQMRAESPTDFFALELPLRARFQRNEQGQVTGMLVYPPRGQGALPTTRAN